jgi:recombination protein RecT
MAATTQPKPLVVRSDKLKNIFTILEAAKPQISQALPKHLTPERMLRVVRTAISKTPLLQECDAVTIIGSVIEASQLGLEPDGVLGLGYLIPSFNKKTNHMECRFQPGYRGLIDLAMRSGRVSWIASELVYGCDRFVVKYGTDRKLEHEPDLDNAERGTKNSEGHLTDLRGAYAVIRYKDGTSDFEYMNRVQLDQIRARSQAVQSGRFSPWVTDEDEMFRKCPIRRGAKRWPLSPEFQKAAILDEYVDAGVEVAANVLEANSEAMRLATDNRSQELDAKYGKPEVKSSEGSSGHPSQPRTSAVPAKSESSGVNSNIEQSEEVPEGLPMDFSE